MMGTGFCMIGNSFMKERMKSVPREVYLELYPTLVMGGAFLRK